MRKFEKLGLVQARLEKLELKNGLVPPLNGAAYYLN